MTSHFWFQSGAYNLLGHLDQEQRASTGIVLVPPFGWTEVCAYRPLRIMARMFAAAGLPTLRYDLPGTGDSTGDAHDRGLLDAWLQSIRDAAAQLRDRAGVERIALFGVHLGALLAPLAKVEGDLILWGGVATGPAFLRELRAAANIERWEYLSGDDAPAPPEPGLESGGFLISPETLEAIQQITLGKARDLRGRRILLLSRDALPHDRKLVDALQAADARVELATGSGYAAMTALPQESLPSEETARAIIGFLGGEQGRQASADDTGMFGILAEPEPGIERGDTGIVFLNPGGVRHIGPNRMWVESARRWADRGVASLRVDLLGIGESEGDVVLDVPALYQEPLVAQVRAAIDWFRERTGLERFLLVGLCSGAFWAFHAALRFEDVKAAILLNPRLFYWDPVIDEQRAVRRTLRGLTRREDWARLFRGGVQIADLRRLAASLRSALVRQNAGKPIPVADRVIQAWAEFERLDKRVTLVFREGEPLLTELPAGIPYVTLQNGGHTFRPLWAQAMAHELIDREVAELTRAVPAEMSQVV